MTLRFASPILSLTLSLFAIPTIVGVIAVTQLVSLDGWAQKQTGRSIAAQSQSASESLAQSLVNAEVSAESPATTIAVQTDQERYNTTLSQIQAGDWLAQQGQFQVAKAAYRQALSQTQNTDLASTATDRLDQLSRQLALKSVLRPVAKSIAKPGVKPASKPVVKLAIKSVVKPESDPNVRSDVKPGINPVLKSDHKTARISIPESSTRPIVNTIVDPIANSFDYPIVNSTASDRLLIPQPTAPDAPQLGQSPSPETPLPAQTIVAESHQWGPEPPSPLN